TVGKLAVGARPGRDFRTLRAAANTNRYEGPVSGRANRETRKLLKVWKVEGLRSPIIIAPFRKADVGSDGKLAAGAIPIEPDIWLRNEFTGTLPRVFAADVRNSPVGQGLTSAQLAPLGSYTSAERGGPVCLDVGQPD